MRRGTVGLRRRGADLRGNGDETRWNILSAVAEAAVPRSGLLLLLRPMMFVLVTMSVNNGRATSVVVGRSATSTGDRSVGGRGSVSGTERLGCPPVSQQSDLNSYMWTLRRNSPTSSPSPPSPPSYFFGTIHVPYTRVWDYIPLNSKQAFRQSDAVHFELDLLDRATVSALHDCQMLPRGQSLADVLPGDIYRRLKRHLDYVRRNMPGWMRTPSPGADIVGTAAASGRSGTVGGQSGNGDVGASSSGDAAVARSRALYAADYLFEAIAGNWERRRPVYVLLMVNSLTENDIRLRGIPVLDLYLAQEATRAGKQRAAIELVEEHCMPLNSMNPSQVLFALNQTLTQYESRRSGFIPSLASVDDGLSPLYTAEDLVHKYNCGDLHAALFTPADEDPIGRGATFSDGNRPSSDAVITRQINDYFRYELIDKRNQRMADRIDRLLTERPRTSFFFALGAGHFLGNNSLIELLQNRGYDIRHTPPSEQIDYTRPRHRLRHDRQRSTQRSQFGWHSPGVTAAGSRILPRSNFNDLWVRFDSTSFDANSIQIQPDVSLIDLTSTPAGVATGAAQRLTTAFCVRLRWAIVTLSVFYLVTSSVAIAT